MPHSTAVEITASELAAGVGGELVGDDVTVDGAAIDSRLIRGGELFVPIVAERDGHDFVEAALSAGAAAYLTSRDVLGGTAVVVDDTARALLDAGAVARGHLPDRVVGITGSVGKTSVKDLLAAALGRTYLTAASEQSFNNELGVPLTLLGAPTGCDAAVVEMGARGYGHIALLAGVARPTVGVVTAVTQAHTEMFGTVDDVARAKSELVAALPRHGAAVLNGADRRVRAMAGDTDARVLLYGLDEGDVVARDVRIDDELRASFRLASEWGEVEVRLAVRGAHQVPNALAAAAAALVCGTPVEAVAAGLGEASLSRWRMHLERAPSGAVVLNDAYNANPASTAAALRALAHLPARRRVACLGTMAELGDIAEEEHRGIATLADSLGIRLVAVGEPAYGVEVVDGIDEAAAAVGPLADGDAVLVKGSRVAGLERLADVLLGRPPA